MRLTLNGVISRGDLLTGDERRLLRRLRTGAWRIRSVKGARTSLMGMTHEPVFGPVIGRATAKVCRDHGVTLSIKGDRLHLPNLADILSQQRRVKA